MSATESSPSPWKTRKPSPSCIFDQDGEVVAMVSHLQPGNRALIRAAPRMKEALDQALPILEAMVAAARDTGTEDQLAVTSSALASAQAALADANKAFPE